MVLWRNLAAGFAASILGAIVALAAAPIYVRSLGIEAYGLIGFFTAMQAVFAILDLGLAPTMSREVARCQVNGEVAQARDLLRTLAIFYWAVAALIALTTLLGAHWLAHDWLQARHLDLETLARAVALMGGVIALRFPVGLYNGVLQGAQQIARASTIQIVMTLLANLGAVLILRHVANTVEAFFLWQLALAVVSVVVVRWAAWHALSDSRKPVFDFVALKRVWRFSAGLGVVAVLSILLTQLDKMVLSRMADLSELGRYTLAGLAARSLTLVITPVFNVIYPRFSALVAKDDMPRIAALYTLGTRLLLAVILPIAAYVAVFSTEIFKLWTGNVSLALAIRPLIAFLVLGTALNGVMTFPYALQLAYGYSRLPAIIVAALVVGFVPLLLGLVYWHGAEGAAWSWAILNAAYLPFGAWLTHRYMLQGLVRRWLARDVGLPVLVTMVMVGGGGLLIHDLIPVDIYRLLAGAVLVPGVLAVVVALTPSFALEVQRWRRLVRRPPAPGTALAEYPPPSPIIQGDRFESPR